MATEKPPQPRPAAASREIARGKVLRIGVILGDKIVEEKLMSDRGPVTIGQSARNTFPVPSPELPRSFTLFEQVGGKMMLNVAESMDGRISEAGEVATLTQLRASGKVQRKGPVVQIPLGDDARGKILVGELTLLFQFVTPPPVQPRPQLPHSVRGSIADRIDPYLAVILSVSMVVHLLGWGYFKYVVEEPKAVTPDTIPDQFARVVMQVPRPPAPKPAEPGPEKADEDTTPEVTDKPRDTKPGPETTKEPVTREAIAARVEGAAPIRVLKSLSAKGQGPIGVGSDKESWEDLDKGLRNVGSGSVVASVGTAGQETRGAGTAEVAAGKEVGVTGPSGPKATGREKVEEEVKVSGRAERIVDIDSGGMDPDKVASTIKSRYQNRVNACYMRALKANPNLAGRVDLDFTVGIAGNVIKANAKGFDAGVDECIEREARTWRFGKPEAPAVFQTTFILRRVN